jgi:TPP-dependent pyruvate/acetoin dehydrogenase alpha subunit
VYEAAAEAVRRARAGEGPTLLECRTYRTRAHSEGMRDTGYRTAEEVAEWKKRDPIKLLADRILREHADAQADMDRIDAELKATVEEAASFALASPLPDASTVMDHVYSV